MKKKILFLISLFCFLGASSQIRIVKAPPFSVRNTRTIEIDSISLSSQSTVFHFTAFANPKHWIKIDAATYIVADGQKYILQSADGIVIDKEEYTDAKTSTRCFSLTFGSIPKEVKQIDFIESDCENCFKIWGIELDSPVLTNNSEIPDAIKELANVKDDGLPLAIPQFVDGDAILKGSLLGYRPELGTEVQLMIHNPLIPERIEVETTIDKDGKFEIKAPVVSTTEILVFISSVYRGTMLVTPNKETSIYIDLQEKCRQEARTRVDKKEASRFIYFDGANAEINNQLQDLNYEKYLSRYFDYQKMNEEICGKTSKEFKEYILSKKENAIAGLASIKLTRKAREFVELKISNEIYNQLFSADWLLKSAYRKTNKLNYEDKLTGYIPPISDKEYYSFLKDSKMNSPLSIYLSEYGYSINNASYMKIGFPLHTLNVGPSPKMLDELIRRNALEGEELKYVNYLKFQNMNSWTKAECKSYKTYISSEISKLSTSKKLEGYSKSEADWIVDLCSKPENNQHEISLYVFDFKFRNQRDSTFTKEELTSLETNPISEIKRKSAIFTDEFTSAFHKKYEDSWGELIKQENIETKKQRLASVLGVDKGIAFDLIEIRSYTNGFEVLSPMKKVELQSLAKLSNPFYSTYLTKKNNALLAELKARESRKLDNVFDVPKVDDDKVLYEIVKPHEGKVIFIDFWATWCGPCRSAMKEFATTKKTFDDKDVVFIYLTDHSSPIKLWEKMIADISGKHYRLTSEQFNYLKKKYGARGIPSYLILNKKGEQVYFKVGFEGSERIAKILNDELAK